MIHPGPVAPRRITAAPVSVATHAVRAEARGRTLQDVIAGEMQRLGLVSGTGRFAPARFSRARFTTGGPARDGKAANYTFIREVGTAIVGTGAFAFGHHGDTGAPFIHCHARIAADAPDVLLGGHFFPADCVGEEPLDLVLHGISGARLVQWPDAETLHSAFEIEAGTPPESTDGLVVRIRPNEDLVEALAGAARAHGITRARVLPSLGSLNAPHLAAQSGAAVVPGRLGMEIIGLSGNIEDGRASLFIEAVDEDGRIHSGKAVPGLCPICVTAEVLLHAP